MGLYFRHITDKTMLVTIRIKICPKKVLSFLKLTEAIILLRVTNIYCENYRFFYYRRVATSAGYFIPCSHIITVSSLHKFRTM